MSKNPPLALQRKVMNIYPIRDFMPLLAESFDKETELLKNGQYQQMIIVIPSGQQVLMTPRLRTLYLSGPRCCNCGCEAHYVVEKKIKTTNRSILNFSENPWLQKSIDIQGDHVIPSSLGGPSDLGNMVPLCQNCNVRKAARETHSKERRWRVRNLMEACISKNPHQAEDIKKKYMDWRDKCFVGTRNPAAYTYDRALVFIEQMGVDNESIELQDIDYISWPDNPDMSLLTDEWLYNVAWASQKSLDSMYINSA